MFRDSAPITKRGLTFHILLSSWFSSSHSPFFLNVTMTCLTSHPRYGLITVLSTYGQTLMTSLTWRSFFLILQTLSRALRPISCLNKEIITLFQENTQQHDYVVTWSSCYHLEVDCFSFLFFFFCSNIFSSTLISLILNHSKQL